MLNKILGEVPKFNKMSSCSKVEQKYSRGRGP